MNILAPVLNQRARWLDVVELSDEASAVRSAGLVFLVDAKAFLLELVEVSGLALSLLNH